MAWLCLTTKPTAANLRHAEDLKDPYESRRMARASRTLYAGTAASQAREVRDVRGGLCHVKLQAVILLVVILPESFLVCVLRQPNARQRLGDRLGREDILSGV